MNTEGLIQWGRTIQTTGNNYNHIYSANTDANNNIYVTGYFGGGADFGNGITLDSSFNHSTFLAKYDSNGTALWAVRSRAPFSGLFIHRSVIDNANNIYFAFTFRGTASFQSTTKTLSSGSTSFNNIGVAKYSPTGAFINAKMFGAIGTANDILKDMDVDGNNNIYLLGHSEGTFIFGANQLTGKGQVILKLDSSLKPIKGKKKYLNRAHEITTTQGIAVQKNGKFVVYNGFYDSVNFGNNVWLKSPWTDNGLSNSLQRTISIVYYDPTLTPIWGRKSGTINLNTKTIINPIGGINIKNDHIYFGGSIRATNSTLGNHVLNHSGNNPKMFVSKIDTLGNFLWEFVNNDSSIFSLLTKCAVSRSGVSITGYFSGKMSVFDKSKLGIANADFYVAKIIDYTITRGYVSSGPYCAGDSFVVPYTKYGRYDTGNYFIAELSDSAGNFDGGHRELGRMKDTTAGIIKGQLPLFNVATNNKYRIRIISTHPHIQSFHKLDTLRLLIYSKDTANAGADQLICSGQRIRLGTTGGSRWRWSPASSMVNPADSANRRPLVNPRNTQEYRVIISDSSGCGVIDTDYVKIYTRPHIETKISGDSTICKGFKQTLKAIVTGSDSTNYWYRWSINGQNFLLSTTSTVTISPPVDRTYLLLVGDSCSDKIDTSYFTVKVKTNLTAKLFGDTALCSGESSTLSVLGSGCDPNKYAYEWFEKGNKTILSSNDSIVVKPLKTTQYYVVFKDTSASLVNTAKVTITVLPKLTLALNTDTTICFGEQAELRATAVGGRNTYDIQWTANNQQVSTNNQLKVSPKTTTTYKAVLSDGCTVNNDSAEITITVRPKLEIIVNQDSTICIGEQAELRATTLGGNTATRGIQWTANNQRLSTNNNLLVNPTTTTSYKVVVSDACTTPNDSATITIIVRAPLSVNVNTDSTICIGEEAELRAVPSGGLTTAHQIQWSTNNTQLSTNNILKVSPTTTTTYKALLSDGCTEQNDSIELTITVRPALELTTIAKDSICSNELLLLTATPSGGLITNHNIQWNTDNSLWTSNQNPATDTPQINTKYIATLSDNCSPSVYDTLEVIVLPIPKANFTVSPTFGCPPLTVTLTDNSTDYDSTQNAWAIGTNEYQGTKTQSHDLLKQGIYNIKLNIKNALGCSDEKILGNAITVFAKPKANFIIKPDIKEVEEPLQLYNLSQNYNSVLWDMGDGNILTPQYGKDTSYKYDENDTGSRTIQLIAINNQGCRDTSKQQILLFDKVNCTIPNAFTPNGDGLNNIFKPICVGVANYTLTIYNRWGQVIYQRQNGAWDGNYADQPLPMGVYMYKIQINAQSKKKKLTYGTIQLIR